MTYHAPFSVQDIQSAVMQGREAERERILELLTKELLAMRESRCPDDWQQSYGVEIAIGLIEGGHE